MKAVLVGGGKIADAHVAALGRLRHLVKLVAVADAEPLMAEQLARRAGIPRRYRDLETMIARERPDVVHVATPPGAHLELASRALDAGCHVYVEKPLTASLADDLRLLDHAARSGKKLTMGLTYHFDPVLETLRSLVAAGRLGRVVHAECVYGYDLGGDYGVAALARPEHWVRRLRGGLLRNTLDHVLDALAEWLPEGTPTVTTTSVASATWPAGLGPEEARVLLRSGGTTAFATFSCRARPPLHRLTLYGTADTAVADLRDRTLVLASRGVLRSSLGRALGPFARAAELVPLGVANLRAFAMGRAGFFEGMIELLRRFYASVANGTAPPLEYERLAWIARVADRVVDDLDAARSGGLPG